MSSDYKELFLFGRAVPSKADENAFVERIIDAANNRNQNGSRPTAAIASIPANDIQQMVVGQNSIGFLFSNNRIARLGFEIVENLVTSEEKPGSSTSTAISGGADTGTSAVSSTQAGASGLGGSGNGGASASSSQQALSGFAASSSSAANRTAKLRRMMIAARRPGAICGRTGVIVDRSRAMLPAESIPEELIAQAQVVLQGKSREVIVRELQRTNLNVNEAVNNLLSRDDDEDDLDEAGEYLHEELLSLLDAGLRGDGPTAVIDSDALYNAGEGYDYLVGQDTRRRSEQKPKDRKSEVPPQADVMQDNFKFADELQYWHDTEGEDFPAGVKGFTKIGATHSSLYAIADNGKVYTWDWKSELPSNKPHYISERLAKDGENADEKIIDLVTCPWRIAALTSKRRVASFMDDYCGEELCSAFFTSFIELPAGVSVERLMVCPFYAALMTNNNRIYWWGVYPFVDRVQATDAQRKKGNEETATKLKEITIGTEVRTRSIPLYANGSVCVNFSAGVPLIGILMESAWSSSETCRFRVFAPDQYALYVREKANQKGEKTSAVDLNQTRKRAAPSETTSAPSGASSAQYKEDAWPLEQVTFFREEPVCDTAIVKLLDGQYVGIVHKSVIEQSERENNGVADEIQILKNHVRLMRKDELMPIPATKISRAPQIHQNKLVEIKIPRRVRKILSAVVENDCFRLLAEKASGDVVIVSTNVSGTNVNEQHLPVDHSILTRSAPHDRSRLALENFGDDDLLVLRDASGSIVPLVPDSSNGFREPVYIGFGPTKQVAVGLRYISGSDLACSLITSNPVLDAKLLRKAETSKGASRLLLVASLVAPEPRTTEPKIESLIQNIQYCNLKKVKHILKELEENADESERRFQILESFTDGHRNIFHTAVMNAFSATNRDQADDYSGVRYDAESGAVLVEGGVAAPEEPEEPAPRKDQQQYDMTEADAASMKFDQRWKDMIGNEPALSKSVGGAGSSASKNSSPAKSSSAKDQPMEEDQQRRKETPNPPPMSARQRQRNAILIVSALASSKAVKPYLGELMRQRDLRGHTPFYSAIERRAYTAALLIWTKLRELEKEEGRNNAEHLSKLAFSGAGNDSVLFLLCYNDTCSFTWTGEEHINQDIFECKTCDLVGSLCCCTECAFTCHRDHDCKLKRTSPTAYCDCWEKCGCRALVAGNQTQRENLLKVLLQDTSLIDQLNSRNEHLLLFLARAVGRQLVEQEYYPRRKARNGQAAAAAGNNNLTIPEHNLEPPKFALTALLSLLGRWEPVKSLLRVGVKQKTQNVPISEDVFHLNEQSGSSHLDKFVFTLLARCPESSLDAIINTLIREANKTGADRDPEVDALAGRFVRSVIRLFSFLCISSQQAMNTCLSEIGRALALELSDTADAKKFQLSTSTPAPSASKASTNILPSYRTITVSGVLSLVRTSLPVTLGTTSSSKENKKKQLSNFVLKCRRIFQILVTYSITELLNSADALMAPVRLGVAKQGIVAHRSGSDPLEHMEKYLYSENEYASGIFKSPSDTKNRDSRFRAPADGDDDRNDGHDSDDSDDSDHPTQRRTATTTTTFASNIAESVAENALSDAFREAGMPRGSVDAPHNEGLSDDSISSSDRDDDHEDELHADEHHYDEQEEEPSEDEEDDEEADEDGHYIDEGDGDEHYFRIDDEDIVDESGDDYSDDEHYSSEDERSPMYDHDGEQPPFDEIDDERRAQQANEARNAAGHRRKRNSHSRRHRHSNRSGGGQRNQDNAGEPMDHGASGAANANREPNAANNQMEVDPTVRSGNTAGTNDTNQSSRRTEPADNPAPTEGRNPETSGRTQPRVISSFRNFFTNEPSAASRSTIPVANQAYTTQSPSIGWAVSRVRQQNDGGESSASVEVSGAAAANERNVAVGDNNNDAVDNGGVRVSKNSKPHVNAGGDSEVFQTKIQLSATFALMVKLVDELLLRLVQHEQYAANHSQTGVPQLLALGPIGTVSKNFKNAVEAQLAPTWEWFSKIMDKIEIMLRFGNALLKSPVGSEITPDVSLSAASLNQSRNEKRYRKKTDRKDEHSTSAKREFFGYFMSLMRAHSSENGDDMPFIEHPNPFRHVALVAEAYLFHMNIEELIEQRMKSVISEVPSKVQTTGSVQPVEVRRFYRRSNSICYPSLTSAGSQNAFKYSAAETAPLATRSSLLKPEADRSDLFMLPVAERTTSEHIKVAKEHGFPHPTQMSIARPPLACEDVMKGRVEREDEEPMQVDQPDMFTEDAEDVQNKCDVETLLGIRVNSARLALTKTFGRWGNAMSYLAKAFSEDVIEYCGNDSFNSILLNELGGFLLKHSQFRARMEKYKNGLTKDLNFSQLTRNKHSLIADVFAYLNTQYSRRTANSSSNLDSGNLPPLGTSRVKATFVNEPGEGSGVVRSFYSAFAESIADMEYLPKEDATSSAASSSQSGPFISVGSSSRTAGLNQQVGVLNVLSDGRLEFVTNRRTSAASSSTSGGLASAVLAAASADRGGIRTRSQQRQAALPPAPSSRESTSGTERKSSSGKLSSIQKFVFSLDSPPYVPKSEQERLSEPPPSNPPAAAPVEHSMSASNLQPSGSPSSRTHRQSETNSLLLGERFYERVKAVQPDYARQITGMIVNGLALVEQLSLISNEEVLQSCVKELAEYLKKSGQNAVGQSKQLESLPLFYRSSRYGFLTPIPGNNSAARRSAFRNVGRIIGICLQQMEILPLQLCRHVLKFILDRPLTWYDLVFFDPDIFDSLRSIVYNDATNSPHENDFYESLGLSFVIDLPPEEGGGTVELKPGGENILVNRDNVLEYVYLFVEKRLLGDHIPALESIKQGVFDVIPADSLNGLTPEDLRLILCGTEQVSIRLLENFTTFMDESSSEPKMLQKMKSWFFKIISKFNDQEKQDLLFFWTGSPSLPPTEEAFTPLPTVMIRPADDHHLPTANTCISRLYIPLYSSKKILRAKLLTAIKARDFGFV